MYKKHACSSKINQSRQKLCKYHWNRKSICAPPINRPCWKKGRTRGFHAFSPLHSLTHTPLVCVANWINPNFILILWTRSVNVLIRAPRFFAPLYKYVVHLSCWWRGTKLLDSTAATWEDRPCSLLFPLWGPIHRPTRQCWRRSLAPVQANLEMIYSRKVCEHNIANLKSSKHTHTWSSSSTLGQNLKLPK